MHRSLIILFFLFARHFIVPVVAQQFGFQVYSLEEGLPQSEALTLMQDSRGSIWVGTNGGGLARFNGDRFETFTIEDGLVSNRVTSIYEDSTGNLWAGCINGISVYDGRKFYNYTEDIPSGQINYIQFFEGGPGRIGVIALDERNAFRILNLEGDSLVSITAHFEELKGKRITWAFRLDNGIVYFHAGNKLYELKNGNLQYSPLNDDPAFGGRLVFPVLFDNQQVLWTVIPWKNGKVRVFTSDQGRIKRYALTENPWWNGIGMIFRDSRGRVWFSNFGNGVAMKDPGTGEFKFFNRSNGLSNNFINNIIEDHEGNIWLGSTGGGLIKYSARNFLAYDFLSVINDDMVRSIYQDPGEYYWFGLASGGLVRFKEGKYRTFTADRYPGIDNLRSIVGLGGDSLLLLSVNGLFIYDGRRPVRSDKSFGLQGFNFSKGLLDGDTLWIGSFNGGLIKIYDGKKVFYNLANGKLHTNVVNDIFKDKEDHIWICSNNGIAEYNNGQFSAYSEMEGLKDLTIVQMTQDHFGRYWLAGYAGGLIILDGNEFSSLTREDGLTSNNIYSILTDRDGNLWAGTQSGVDKIALNDTGGVEAVVNFGVYDGFTGIECNGNANFMDHDGCLWFGTVKGAMKYDPDAWTENTIPPITHITGLKLFFKKVDWEDPGFGGKVSGTSPWFRLPRDLVLPFDLNHLSFDFEALSYRVHEKVKYSWILEGLDKDWSPASKKTEAVYTNVPPGNYSFKVKAMNNDGLWNEHPETFSFTIRPAWWNSWWFITLLVLAGMAVLVLLVRFRISLIEARRRELEEIVTSKTAEVRASRDKVASQNKLLEQQKTEIMNQAERLRMAYNDLEKLGEIGKTITAQLSVEHIVDTVYDRLNEIIDATVFGIGLVNEKKRSIDFPGVREKGHRMEFFSFSLDDKARLSARCVREKEEIFINDFEKEYGKYLPVITPAGETGNSSSIIYLPLISDRKVVGVITIQSFEKNAYTEYHLNLLRNLAVYTRIAIENAASYQRIELQSANLQKANRNISLQKKEIEKANAELIELNKEKNHLIGIVAHDLRNPLTSTISVAANLHASAKGLGKDEKDGLQHIVTSLKRMDKMISKILDISMIEQNRVNMKFERVNFSGIVREVTENLRETAGRKGIGIQLEIPDIYGRADRYYLMQVYENLLSNAIKFSPVNSRVTILSEDLSGETRISFIDEGPGISEEDKKKIFNKYQKLSAKPTGGEHSTGLGLSIVKKYVDLMGGRVWCESGKGRGARFIVSFEKPEH